MTVKPSYQSCHRIFWNCCTFSSERIHRLVSPKKSNGLVIKSMTRRQGWKWVSREN